MTFEDILEEANSQVREFKEQLTEVKPEEIGLDRRAGRLLWIDENGILVHQSNDNVLQYYGGFEYVDKELRLVLGEWVYYSAEDNRVRRHLEQYFLSKE